MASIDNTISLVKTPPQKESVTAPAGGEDNTSTDKPFSQLLNDEIEKESKVEDPIDPKASIEAELSKGQEQEQEKPVLALVDVSSKEESDRLLSGNNLPIAAEELTETQIKPDVAQVMSPLATEMRTQVLTPKSVSSLSAIKNTAASVEEVPEFTDSDLNGVSEEPDFQLIKSQKQYIDGQPVVKTEIQINDSAKLTKTLQTVSLGTTSAPEANRSSTELTPLQSHISTPVSNKQWGGELSQKVSVLINTGQQQIAEIRLNPAHLGPLSVRLQLDEDQANISFVTNHQAVKEAIEMSLPKLREQLQQQGLDLGQVDIENKNSKDETASDSELSQAKKESSRLDDESDARLEDVVSIRDISTGVSVFA